MTTHKEALTHLKAITEAFGPGEGIELDQKAWSKLHSAIKEALAQPEQEPDEVDIRSRLYQRIHELETQLAQPEQSTTCGEPVVWGWFYRGSFYPSNPSDWADPNFPVVALYPHPLQRTWVGLTDEDIRQCSRDVVAGGKENSVDRFAYAIEAKLKEKNT